MNTFGPRAIWGPADLRAAVEAAAGHEAVPAEPAELARVIDIRTRERIA